MHSDNFQMLNDPVVELENLSPTRVTDHAKRMIVDSVDRTFDRGIWGVVPPVVLLWSMLRWERKFGTIILERCGGPLELMEKRIDLELSRLSQLPLTPLIDFRNLTQLIHVASEEAAGMGDWFISSEHLLLALLRSTDDFLTNLFGEFGVSYLAYRSTFLSLREDRRVDDKNSTSATENPN